ncbi:T9SS type A sorting domain-containing protein [Aquimarina rubra]|uniref:T9SS type A sorting domain-containing protein n=1 Tax=Aquimarina rubra TaxID=1920033 RepID=A0ABW5LM32_9FLAO
MKKIILVIAIFFIAHTSNGQCSTENIDETLVGVTNGAVDGSSGQSFTPTCNGILNTIGVPALNNSANATVTIRSGEGYGGSVLGTLLNQTTFPSTDFANDYSVFDFSSLNIVLIAGQQYTFDISSTALIVFDNEADPDYPNGQRYSAGIAQPGTDLLFSLDLTAIPCTDPDVPMVTFAPSTICDGNNATLTISGNLNDATAWHIYTGSCGGTEIGSTTSNSFVVSPSVPSTTYFVRGEGGLCVIPGSCGTVNVNVTANDIVTYTAPSDLCLDAGVQNGLGGGTPTGGIYSGPGVTDDGNGMTYSFDPAIAGLGTHIINYTSAGTCSDSANDTIEVFDVPTVTFTAPADLCIDAGVQNGLGDGTPTGGVYSGTGVTDDGNGMTYSFDPTTAGAGVHTITYSFTNANGCINTASDDIEVFDLPTVTLTAPVDLCIDAGVQNGLGGGTPTGGVYSGTGVTDDGNGMTYSFDPTTAGAGVHTITYSFTNANGCTNTASDDIEVFDLPTVTFTAPVDLCIDAGIQNGLGGGTPTGGVYSGTGVTDDGNGMTYSFDPTTAGAGVHTITYSFTNANGCTNTASDDIEVFDLPTVTFTALADLCIDAGIQNGLGGATPTGGTYSGNGVTDDGNGLTYSFDPTTAGAGVHTITYSFTNANGCANTASDTIEVFDLPTVTLTAPVDLCIDAGVQNGLGGGTPTGGVYSGTGVTDDGNGMTYSFDPTTAGVGVHTISYSFTNANGCANTASDDIEVFDLPTVTFTALADLCIDAGVQNGLGGGTPTGGVYSGTGVTDDGNGMTYSFDPTTAGTGVHTITYSFTNANGCINIASDDIEVFDLPTVTFTALADLCIDAGIQNGLGGGSPTGGVYSGTGVTDDGNGMTYSFDPTTAGAGVHTITYSFTNANGCTNTASDDIEVFDLPTVTFTAPANLCIDAGVQNGLGGGTPTGGVYSGTGVTDDGNGMTYSFDPTTAGAGVHTITYSFNNANGCTDTASDDIEVFDLPTVTFTAPVDLCIDAGIQNGLGGGTPTGGVYSGTGITDDGNGMTYSFDPTTAGAGVHIITYSFTNTNGCANTASDTIEVFDLPTVTFTALADLCIDAGIQNGLGGGTPTGGVYSGTGVTDDGNGMTYSFDPTTSGAGVHTITYSFTNANGCANTASDTLEVFDLPTVTFTTPADLCIDAGVQNGLGGATPTGGVYSGTGVTDDGNGMTYSFDPTTAGAGVHTITYSFTNANGCTDTASDDIEVFDLPDASVDDSLMPIFTANTAGASYQWIDCDTDTPLSGEVNQSFTATENGNYAVEITVNGCTQRSSCFLVETFSVDEQELLNNKLRIYPVPTTGMVNISIPIKKATIYNVIGKKVFETNTSSFDISQLNSGVYFINIEGEKGNAIRRIIKE